MVQATISPVAPEVYVSCNACYREYCGSVFIFWIPRTVNYLHIWKTQPALEPNVFVESKDAPS